MKNEENELSKGTPIESEAARSLTCFVIGPIGNRHADPGTEERLAYEEAIQVLEEVIEPACKSVGLQPVRADGLARAGEIPDQVFQRLLRDDVVIADLTGANANVMYELGLRHTRNKLTIQIGEYSRLPFDVNVIRTVQFSRSPHGLVTARKELIELLEAGIGGEFDPVTATRIWNDAEESARPGELAAEQIARVEDREAEDEGPPGFVDLLAAGEEGQEQVTEAAERISASMVAMGELAQSSSDKMTQSDAQGRGMKGRLALTIEFASGLSSIADDFAGAVDMYVEAMSAVSSANLAIIERLEEDPSQLEEALDWALMTRRLAATARDTLSETDSFAETLTENAKLARVLREPTNKIVNAVGEFAAATAVVDEWDRRLQTLGVPVPPEDWELPDNDVRRDDASEGPADTEGQQ